MKTLPVLLCLVFLGACSSEGEKAVLSGAEKEASASPARKAALAAIDAAYRKDLLSFLEPKCLDCHGQAKAMPGYYKIPGVRQFIDRDIAEARADLDMRAGFPFGSGRSTEKDLDELREVVDEGEMPPLAYKLLHRGTGLTADEKKAVLSWVERSEKALAAAR